MTTGVTLRLASRLDEIERISRHVEAFGDEHGLAARAVFEVNLALDEILTNIVSYAYDDDAEHEIVVRLATAGGRIDVEVEDDGRAFDPRSVEEPDLAAAAEDRAVGGLGLSLVRKLMTGLAYERRDGRNVLRMSHSSAGGAGPRASGVGAPVLAESRDGGVLVLRVDGRLDSAGSVLFEERMLGLLEAGETRIVVDGEGIDYVNSAGLRALLVATKRLAGRGAVALAALSGQVRDVVDVVGFASVLPVCGSVEEAVAAVRDAAPRGS